MRAHDATYISFSMHSISYNMAHCAIQRNKLLVQERKMVRPILKTYGSFLIYRHTLMCIYSSLKDKWRKDIVSLTLQNGKQKNKSKLPMLKYEGGKRCVEIIAEINTLCVRRTLKKSPYLGTPSIKMIQGIIKQCCR